MLNNTLISGAVAGAVLALSAPAFAANAPVTIRGVVSGTYFTAPVISNTPSGSAPANTVASLFQSAKVCIDANDNGACDAGETSALTKADGSYLLATRTPGTLIAEISTTSLNNGKAVAQRMVLRAPADQVSAALINPLVPAKVAISPLTTEIARIMEDDGVSFETAKNSLATRLSVNADVVLSDTTGANADVLKESVLLSNRFAFAAKMVDRHDVSPAALAADANATGPAISMKEAYQAAMNLEGIPRYDHVFLIVLENKATSSIKDSKYAPRINAYLNAGNHFTSYYSTGNPSEPNRLAIASADDFGVTDDSAFNCYPTGANANAIEDLPLPPGVSACNNGTNHNHKSKQNLFSALSSKGMNWRVYSESKNPGSDWRKDGTADNSIVAQDYIYTADEPVGAIGTPGLQVRLAGALYAAKHNGSVFFQNVRSSPEFLANNRTMGGGQWDQALKAIAPSGWNIDQFSDDLASGDIAQLNILEPDQCDDMHGVTLVGTMPGSTTTKAASDCSGNALIYRGDKYTDFLIKKIQASPLWNNPQKRVAIVMMFDEGTATSGFNSCCGWNTSGSPLALGPLVKNADGTVSNEVITNYKQGNKGHGTSTFGVLNNQPAAPKGVVDSDAYSHISLVRTLQDMFQLADPADDWSYMNRSKYSQKFIAANILNLPEYAGSADAHFDAVRPMNHGYVIPAGYVQKNGYPTIKQVGPDADQRNGWALK
ncbi:alkaline phosphatase family protein [Duganella callida]|uniref:Phosphoesterase n=1 Tax=Duganella callida TaxID=2561932 RepID=A0A4Y9SCR0_9BURK|nr:alkaline phosphatase family protein [Duganella callida]TFW20299.1 phosphoesterase [Duganella callida]